MGATTDEEDLERISRVLRSSAVRHNRFVVILAAASVAMACLLWALSSVLLFGLLRYWGVEPQAPLPFFRIFAGAAILSCVAALLVARFRKDGYPRDDATAADHFLDLSLMAPRVTLSIWGTLSAWRGLSAPRLLDAARLLRRLHREGKIELSRLAADIPDSKNQAKAVMTLQILNLAFFLRNDLGHFLVGRKEKVRKICEPRIRLPLPPKGGRGNSWTNPTFPA